MPNLVFEINPITLTVLCGAAIVLAVALYYFGQR